METMVRTLGRTISSACLPPDEEFNCTGCGANFTTELFLTDHLNICQKVKTPGDWLFVDTSTLKTEPYDEMFEQMGTVDEQFVVKSEEIELSEPAISSITSPVIIQQTETKTRKIQLEHSYSRSSQLQSVYRRVHKSEALHMCDVCDYITSHPKFLKEHRQTHNYKPPIGKSTYQCSKCNYDTTTRDHLSVHVMLKHTQIKHHKCTLCDYKCRRRSVLRLHMLTHTNRKPYKCKRCDYACKRPCTLVLHERKHNGEGLLKCNHCDYTTFVQSSFENHMLKHSMRKPFKCTQCAFACVRPYFLSMHMRKHTGEGLIKCNLCDYTTPTSGRLRIHMKKHCAENPYKCMSCEYVCGHSAALRVHMENHTREAQYKCSLCDYSSKRSGQLTLHIMRDHTTERAFKCTICDYSSERHDVLTAHMRLHTKESV